MTSKPRTPPDTDTGPTPPRARRSPSHAEAVRRGRRPGGRRRHRPRRPCRDARRRAKPGTKADRGFLGPAPGRRGPGPDRLHDGMHLALYIAAGIVAVAAIAVAVLLRGHDRVPIDNTAGTGCGPVSTSRKPAGSPQLDGLPPSGWTRTARTPAGPWPSTPPCG